MLYKHTQMHAPPNQNAVGSGKYAKLKVTPLATMQCVP